jgi:hypothetical protein
MSRFGLIANIIKNAGSKSEEGNLLTEVKKLKSLTKFEQDQIFGQKSFSGIEIIKKNIDK